MEKLDYCIQRMHEKRQAEVFKEGKTDNSCAFPLPKSGTGDPCTQLEKRESHHE